MTIYANHEGPMTARYAVAIATLECSAVQQHPVARANGTLATPLTPMLHIMHPPRLLVPSQLRQR